MKKSNLNIFRTAKSIFAILVVLAVSICAAFAQISEQDYFKQQIAELTKQIAAKPKDDKLYVKRGELFMKLTAPDTDKAFADAQKALAINPKNQAAIKLRDEASTQSFFSDSSLTFYDYDTNTGDKSAKTAAKPAATPPPNTGKPINSAAKPADNGQIADLTKKIAADSKNDRLYVERGRKYLGENKLAEALADAEKALKIRATNDEAYVLRGDIKAAKQDYSGSEMDYRQAVKLRNESGIAGRIASHSGKTIPGIVVKGKMLGNSGSYASLEEIKKDWTIPLTKLKIIVKDKGGRLSVYEGIAVVDNPENLREAARADRPEMSREESIFTDFSSLKLAFNQSLFLPEKDKLTSRQETEIVDILDFSNLSVVRRQSVPFRVAADDAYLDMIEAEINSKHFEEAKKAYLEQDKIFKSLNSTALRFVRVNSLLRLYKGDAAMQSFVEEEMKKHQFTTEEKRRVRFQPFIV